MENPVRAFIAIEVDPKILEGIERFIAPFRNIYPAGFRWVRPENQHLTLKFLGNCQANGLAEISRMIETAASGAAPFQLEISAPGAFPTWQRPRTFWLGFQPSEPLQHLFENLDHGLTSLSFAPEGKRFSAHLTLCRVSDHADPRSVTALSSALKSAAPLHLPAMQITGVTLFRSILKPGGPVYSALSHHNLNQPRQL